MLFRSHIRKGTLTGPWELQRLRLRLCRLISDKLLGIGSFEFPQGEVSLIFFPSHMRSAYVGLRPCVFAFVLLAASGLRSKQN